MASVDLDEEFLKLFYDITNSKVPSDINLINLKKQLISIVDLFKELNANARKPAPSRITGTADASDEEASEGPSILVVDDLGVITYQLRVLLSKFEYDIDCSQEIYDAVNKFKKRKYDYVVMDLFIPTEREGFILLTELRKMSLAVGKNTVIGVITASPRKEIEQQCKARGADFFIEKSNDWQNNLLEIMDGYINAGKTEAEEEF